jgi:hypothetical protein
MKLAIHIGLHPGKQWAATTWGHVKIVEIFL